MKWWWFRRKSSDAQTRAAVEDAVHELFSAYPVKPLPFTPAAIYEHSLSGLAPAVEVESTAPTVTVSRGRRRCEDCGRRVYRGGDQVNGKFVRGKRHICLGNAHIHIDTLTKDEREQLITDLKAEGRWKT